MRVNVYVSVILNFDTVHYQYVEKIVVVVDYNLLKFTFFRGQF